MKEKYYGFTGNTVAPLILIGEFESIDEALEVADEMVTSQGFVACFYVTSEKEWINIAKQNNKLFKL